MIAERMSRVRIAVLYFAFALCLVVESSRLSEAQSGVLAGPHLLPADSIRCGAPVSGTLSRPDTRSYAFDGHAGDLLWIAVVRIAGDDPFFQPTVELFGPEGDRRGAATNSGFSAVLATSGRYTLHVSAGAGTHGRYQLSLEWVVPVAKQCSGRTLKCGTPAVDSVERGGQDLWTFDGHAGDRLWVSVVGMASDDTFFQPQAVIYPSGSAWRIEAVNNGAIVVPLKETGTYTLQVLAGAGIRGSYRIRYEWLAPTTRVCSARELACGRPVTLSLDRGDQHLWSWDGKAGQELGLPLRKTFGGDVLFQPALEVYSPTGSIVGHVHQNDNASLRLPVDGQYTIRAFAGAGLTGGYTLQGVSESCRAVEQSASTRPSQPVVFIHGLCSGPATWESVETVLRRSGWVAGGPAARDGGLTDPAGSQLASFPKDADFYLIKMNDPFITNGLEAWASDLELYLRRIRGHRADSKPFKLVAHSAGGLAARYYIQSSRFRRDVQHLITYGTPHQGAPVANWPRVAEVFVDCDSEWFLSPSLGIEQMASDGTRAFLDGLNRGVWPPSVMVTSLAGDWPGCSGDCVVPLSSQLMRNVAGLLPAERSSEAVRRYAHLTFPILGWIGQVEDVSQILWAVGLDSRTSIPEN